MGLGAIRSLSKYGSAIRRLGEFRIVCRSPTEAMLDKVGFSNPPSSGDSILPNSVGSYSDFNANGKYIVRKDLPKVRKTFMVWRTWNDWHGNPHSGTQYPTRDVYQRELITPPCEYLIFVQSAGASYIASRALSIKTDLESSIIHLLNLFLELFGNLEIVGTNLEEAVLPNVRRLHWKVLPPGPYPFDKAKQELSDYFDKLPHESRPVVLERVKTITQHVPDFVALGVGGFSDYMVFGFPAKDIYVLESPALGNATYVFRGDWETLSMCSKKEILDSNLHEARVIHSSRWKSQMRAIIVGN